MSNENLAPRDAKTISVILRSLGIEECEPKVIVQLLEFAYKYSCDIFEDAQLYASLCARDTINNSDIKLALHTKAGKYFLPAPPRSYLQSCADTINSRPLNVPDTENLLRVPSLNVGLYNTEYTTEQMEANAKKRRIH